MIYTSSEGGSSFPGFPLNPGKPAYYDPERQSWQVFRYAEVKRVLSEYPTFSSRRGGHVDPRENRPGTSSLLDLDPPEHRQLRELLAQAFTPQSLERLEPRIRAHSHHLIDLVIGRGEMDAIEDFAARLPLSIIMELFGVPAEDQQRLREWSGSFTEVLTSSAASARSEMRAYFVALIERRRRRPEEDLLSALLVSRVDGEQLTRDEIVNCCFLFVLAGNETTRNLIGNALLCFDRHPAAQAAVRADLTLLPGALEEVLRYLPPLVQLPRIAAVDTTIDGQQVQAGQWVTPWISSANRDAACFAHPAIFDITRSPNRHLSFSAGVHHCIGASLARLETRIAFQILFSRLPSLKVLPDVEPLQHPLAYGLKHLPIVFTPA